MAIGAAHLGLFGTAESEGRVAGAGRHRPCEPSGSIRRA